MQPEEAVKQIQCVANTSLDDIGQRVAPMYKPTFDWLATEGTEKDVTLLADQIAAEIRAGNRPGPGEADGFATEILSRRTLTDGGT
jgi:hypothetical protein